MLEILVVFLLLVLAYLLYKNLEWKYKFEERVKKTVEEEESRIKEEAIARSARTLSGKTLEKFVPFLEKFGHDPHDVRWLGDPVDLVVFNGYSKGEPSEVVFCEVKSGGSKLSTMQNKIKELVEDKKVKWEEFRVG